MNQALWCLRPSAVALLGGALPLLAEELAKPTAGTGPRAGQSPRSWGPPDGYAPSEWLHSGRHAGPIPCDTEPCRFFPAVIVPANGALGYS